MKKLLALLPFMIVLFSFLSAPVRAQQFDPLGQVCENNPQAIACQESRQGQNENPVNSAGASVVNILSIAAGAIAIVVIIIAGITMTMSQGDSGKIKTARDAIIYSVVGLIVIFLARLIVLFIVDRAN